jgi:hypothetical protein
MYQSFEAGTDPRIFHDALYAGAIARFDRLAEMRAIVAFTQTYLNERFAPHPPPEIHRHMARRELSGLLSAVRRDYSGSPVVKKLWQELFETIGLDATRTARDRLVLRFQPPSIPADSVTWDRNTSTVGFHRDTWGTNLYSQVNWWAPVFPLSPGRTMAFFPTLWDVPLPNDSRDFDMAEAMKRVREARPDLKAGDMLPQLLGGVDPRLAQPVTIEPGSVIAFSAQHAHAGVTNHTDLTRISLDTRTLWLEDWVARRGAPNIDGRAPLMAPGMFQRISDGTPVSTLLGINKLEAFEGPWPGP